MTAPDPSCAGRAGITAELIRLQAAATDGRDITAGRAEEIAREVDRLNRAVADATRRTLAVLADPASFSAVLEASRDPWPDGANAP